MLTVVAMESERQFAHGDCIVTGAGALNVINALKDVDKDEPIFNIGYAGSNVIPVGTRVKIGAVKLYHPNVSIDEPEYVLDGDIPCYTSNDFVLNTEIKEPCVFDMELAYILAMGFKKVTAEKIISDNLSLKEFSEVVNGTPET